MQKNYLFAEQTNVEFDTSNKFLSLDSFDMKALICR